jgi:uncharacterized protein (DUF927 family)
MDNEAILRKVSFASHLLNDQGELVKLTVRRSEESFKRLSSLVEQLCQVVNRYNPKEPLVELARQELEGELLEWA